MKKITLLLLLFLLILTSCSDDKNINGDSTNSVSNNNNEAEKQELSIDIWDVDPFEGYDDVDNWLTTRFGVPTFGISGATSGVVNMSGEQIDNDLTILYNRDDFYNSKGEYIFVPSSFEKGGAFILKNGYAGVINPKGEITSEAKYGYITLERSIVYEGGIINHDYSVDHIVGYIGGGTSGLSMTFFDGDGNFIYPLMADYIDDCHFKINPNSYVYTNLYNDSINKGIIKEEDNILLNTYASRYDCKRYCNTSIFPSNLITGYIVLSKDGYKVLNVTSDYIPVDFSNNIAMFIRSIPSPEEYINRENGHPIYYSSEVYRFEQYCSNFDYGEIIYVDSNGKIIASGIEDGYGFYEGYAAVKKNGKWGYIDTQGNVAVDFIFDKTTAIADGKAWVIYNGRTGRLNIKDMLDNNVPFIDEVLNSATYQVEISK